MACPLCCDRCTCSAASTGKQIAGTRVSVLVEPNDDIQTVESAADTDAENHRAGNNRGQDWRGEVANRVQAHRARRRRRYDPESSLSLAFTAPSQVPANSADDGENAPTRARNLMQQYHQTSSAPELQSSDFEGGGVSTLVDE